MKIKQPGFYRTENNKKVEVVAVRGRYAVGFCDDVATVWLDNGPHWNRCNGTEGSDQRLAIVAEWRDPVTTNVDLQLCISDAGNPFVRIGDHPGIATVIARKTVTITEGEGMK